MAQETHLGVYCNFSISARLHHATPSAVAGKRYRFQSTRLRIWGDVIVVNWFNKNWLIEEFGTLNICAQTASAARCRGRKGPFNAAISTSYIKWLASEGGGSWVLTTILGSFRILRFILLTYPTQETNEALSCAIYVYLRVPKVIYRNSLQRYHDRIFIRQAAAHCLIFYWGGGACFTRCVSVQRDEATNMSQHVQTQ